MLDSMGGTEVVAVRPRFVSFIRGTENLTCMSLSEHGTLRWFTRCCKTPIGNTPRDYKRSHAGLIHTCLELGGVSLDESFGAVVMRINTHSAKGNPAKNSPPVFVWSVLRYLGSMAWSRVSGKYRVNPFFQRDGAPRVTPRVLTPAEREALFRAV